MKPQRHAEGFTLTEVVLALGVVAFAIVAILGVLPTGLKTGRSAQDETRAAQIGQGLMTALASQAQTKFPNLVITQAASGTAPAFSYNIDLNSAHQYDTMAADNDGHWIALNSAGEVVNYPFQILVQVDPNPVGFDSGFASRVTIRVISPPNPNPNQAPPLTSSVRDYVRIISKY